MRELIDETERRRKKQISYNEKHGITPTTVSKTREQILDQTQVKVNAPAGYYVEPEEANGVADPVSQYMSADQLKKSIAESRKKMEKSAKEMDYPAAAKFRDEMLALQKLMDEKYGVK